MSLFKKKKKKKRVSYRHEQGKDHKKTNKKQLSLMLKLPEKVTLPTHTLISDFKVVRSVRYPTCGILL